MVNTQSILKYSPWAFILLIILVVNIFRFVALDKVPYFLHVDESGTALSFSCLAQEGIGARGEPYPLFDMKDWGTARTFVYSFPGALWVKIFGNSIASVRAVTGVFCLFGLVGVFFLGRLVGKNWRAGVLALLCATISPWMWTLSRFAIETALSPYFLAWGIYFFLRSNKWYDFVLSGISCSFALYTYPPMRMFLPMALVVLIMTRYLITGQHWMKRNLAIFALVLLAVSGPLIYGTVKGTLQGRFNRIGIHAADYWAKQGKEATWQNISGEFVRNYVAHLNPYFLFYKGSPQIITYTTNFPGQIFSWLGSFAFFGAGLLMIGRMLMKTRRHFFDDQQQYWACCIFGGLFFLAIIPPSLTWDDIPHMARSITIWPLMMVLFGVLLQQMMNWFSYLIWPVLIIAGLFSSLYLTNYFGPYREYSKGYFDFWLKDWIDQAKTQEDWLKIMAAYHHSDMHLRYHMMRHLGDSCLGSYEHWLAVSRFVAQQIEKNK